MLVRSTKTNGKEIALVKSVTPDNLLMVKGFLVKQQNFYNGFWDFSVGAQECREANENEIKMYHAFGLLEKVNG
jgi:hypothetical protein